MTIKGGLYVRPGATFVLGSEENPAHTGTISGGVHATNAASVQIHFSKINGGVNLVGGSGPFGGPFDITWNTIEAQDVINGMVNIDGYNGFWQGFFRNTVNGAMSFTDNTVVDRDGNEVQTNTIHGTRLRATTRPRSRATPKAARTPSQAGEGGNAPASSRARRDWVRGEDRLLSPVQRPALSATMRS